MFKLLCFLVLGVIAVSSRRTEFFRKDYVYVEEYDAFYKLHLDKNGKSWSSTFLACNDEGADLFYPRTPEEWRVAAKLIEKAYNDANVTDIFVGIHDQFGLGEYITVNGKSASVPISIYEDTSDFVHEQCLTMNVATGEYTRVNCVDTNVIHPFLCRKIEDVSCPTIDRGYDFNESLKKCYKVNRTPKSWSQAYETCFVEGGMLLVITSQMESDVIAKLTTENDGNAFFIGIKDMFDNGEYFSIKGQKVQNSGFNEWYSYDSNRKCVGVFNQNQRVYLTSIDCNEQRPFICEMSVN